MHKSVHRDAQGCAEAGTGCAEGCTGVCTGEYRGMQPRGRTPRCGVPARDLPIRYLSTGHRIAFAISVPDTA
eukprot:802897-Rhodomonas_salina.1